MTAPLDRFTERRLTRFIETFRAAQGQLPTIQDFAKEGMSEDVLKAAIKAGAIEPFYVTLTNGTIMKGFKIKQAE